VTAADPEDGDPGADGARAVALLRVVLAVGLGLGAFLGLRLFVEHVLITRNLYGEPLGTSPEAVREFPVHAVLCIGLLVVGAVAAVLADDGRAAFVGVLLVVAGIGVVLVAGAELGVWQVELPEPTPASEPDQPVCRSGGDSSDCPGG
jgi:hypothetical protein